MAMAEVDFVCDGQVATAWLNRPQQKNALTAEIVERLAEIAAEVDADPALNALVIRGRGGTFCSGFDLGNLRRNFLGQHAIEIAVLGAKACERIATMRKPSVAVLEGHVTAGGFELMLACDFAISDEQAQIGDFHIRRALIGGAGPIYRLPRILGTRLAKELMLTGKLITGRQAEDWGLVNLAVPAAELDASVERFLADLVDKSPLTMWITKMTVDRSLDADSQSLMVMEHLAASLVMGSDDAAEGVAAFLEKRKPRWKAMTTRKR